MKNYLLDERDISLVPYCFMILPESLKSRIELNLRIEFWVVFSPAVGTSSEWAPCPRESRLQKVRRGKISVTVEIRHTQAFVTSPSSRFPGLRPFFTPKRRQMTLQLVLVWLPEIEIRWHKVHQPFMESLTS